MKKVVLLITVFAFSTMGQYQLQDAYPNLPGFSNPIDFQNPGDCTNRVFVVEQDGIIKVFQNTPDVTTAKVFLDITGKVLSGGELGLLGLAFHPDYEYNGYFYLNYTASNPRRTVIARYQCSAGNPDSANENSEFILLTQNQPYSNHNGGQLTFGPDGYLYIALGDGGSGGDPEENGQDRSSLLGKILRIDVDNPESPLNYGNPADNPFKNNTAGYREEIFAYGLRNPWRFSFDPVTGWLWCGDVGQGNWEEIDIIENGKNYGWDCYEGNHPYELAGCNEPEYIPPIYEYSHSLGVSITGGYVYRGPNLPELSGKYIYADYGSRSVWALEYDGVNPPSNQLLLTAPASVVSFGVDLANELYICTFGGSNGRIYKFVPTSPIDAPSNLTAIAVSGTNVELNWSDNSDNEDGFKIERKEGSNNFVLIDSIAAGETFYTDMVNQSMDYRYRVYAYNSTDVSGYSNEGCTIINTLPVELISFTYEINRDENKILLKWVTASEKNNHGFEIQRSLLSPPFDKGGKQGGWATIGFVKGNGTTTEVSSYQFINDVSSYGADGIVHYRIKQIDFNGSYSYSDIISVEMGAFRSDYYLRNNYPNPFNPSTNIGFNVYEESKVKIEIINSLGEVASVLVDEVKQAGFYNETWNAQNFSSGVYYVKMNAESLVSDRRFQQVIKMVYMK